MQAAVDVVEKRQQPRKESSRPLKILDLGARRLMGTLVNITTGGILMLSRSLTDVNCVFELGMALPEAIDGSRSVRFIAKCVWSDIAPDTPEMFWSGFSISYVQEEDAIRMERLIDEYL